MTHADGRIRRYIATKRRLIALLNEQKQAIIDRAVTRGLDSNVRLKPSGVEWLGDVPEHWEVEATNASSSPAKGLSVGGRCRVVESSEDLAFESRNEHSGGRSRVMKIRFGASSG